MTTASLFTGGGGLDIGAERAGFDVTLHAEVDTYACRVLAHRYPHVPNLGDVTTIDWRPYVGKIRFIIGGFPCQDISLAGKGAGIEEGTRSGLWIEYLRAVIELAPDGLLPTPTTQDAANNGGPSQHERNSKPLNAVVDGKLEPRWVEWVMGFPDNWTATP